MKFAHCARSFAAGAILLTIASCTAADRRMNDYRVGHYDLAVGFNMTEKSLRGSVQISAVAVQPLRRMVLSASSKTLSIDSVIFRGRRLPFQHSGELLIINLQTKISPSFRFAVMVYYHGTSTFRGAYDDGGVYFSPSGRIATSSEPSFAHRWWPCKDLPSNKATTTISITVPDSMTAVSNGVLDTVSRHDGLATYRWQTHYPIATYLVSVAAARYRKFDAVYTGLDGTQMTIDYYVFPDDYPKAKIDFEHTADILGFFASTFCEYPFLKEKFGYAEVEGDATMENQTICSIQNTLITGEMKGELTFAHETAHHWWGNLITPLDWHHTWLNEGFATYAEALYLEHTRGHDAYLQYIARLMNVPAGAYAGSVIGASDTAFWDSFAPRVYSKGALVLHMLREMVGDTLFFRMMKNYLNEPRLRYGNARTEDFIAACSRTAGRDLAWFFRQWVYASADTIDRPVLDCRWRDRPSSPSQSVTLTLKQRNAPSILYRLPLDVGIRTAEADRNFTIVDSLAEQSFTFPVEGTPVAVDIDKDGKVFKSLRMEKE